MILRRPGIRPLARFGLLAGASGLVLAPAIAAQSLVVTAPRSTIVTNYNRLPVGQHEGIEAGAFIARANDAGAAWYNPAGLAQSQKSVLNTSANAYEWTRLTLSGLDNTTGRAQLSGIATFVGAVLGEPLLHSKKWRIGVSITTPVSWSPGGFDVSFGPPSPGIDELFRYASNSEFRTMIWGLSLGHAPRGVGKSPVRLGAGLAIAQTSLSEDLTVSDRVTTPTTALTQLRNFVSAASTSNLLVTGGLQWDVASRATLGVRLVSSGIRLTSSGRLVLEGSNFAGNFSEDATFRDDEARFQYKLPLEIDAGLTVRLTHGAIEADVRYYGSIGRYALYESAVLATLTRVSGDEPPVVASAPYTSTYTAAQSVTNVSVGGNYRITRELTVHAGFTSDASPIGSPSESIFVSADLYRVTSGLTFAWTSLAGSVGLAYGWGSGEPRPLGETSSGPPARTRLDVRTINAVYAFSYAFGGRPTP